MIIYSIIINRFIRDIIKGINIFGKDLLTVLYNLDLIELKEGPLIPFSADHDINKLGLSIENLSLELFISFFKSFLNSSFIINNYLSL